MRDAIITAAILGGFALACAGTSTHTTASSAPTGATIATVTNDDVADVSKTDATTAVREDAINPPAVVSLPSCGPGCICGTNCQCTSPGQCLQVQHLTRPPVTLTKSVPQPTGHYEYCRAGLFGRQSYRVWVSDQRQQTYSQPAFCVGPNCSSCGRR